MTISTWSPVRNAVTNISLSRPCIVTTQTAHGFFNGLFVSFFFPSNFGMQQLIGNSYQITVIDSTSFSIDVDSSSFDPFDDSDTTQTAQVIPGGEVATTLANLEHNTLTPIGG